ncbi:MAG: nitrous oxide reductase accessory protein NosL [Gemmatimonadaceae bacterium]
MRITPRVLAPALALALGIVAACGTPRPRALLLGEDQCAYCRMEITDPRFGAQVIMRTGRIYVFDAVECLVGFVRGHDAELIGSVWVADAATGGAFIRAEEAGFLLDGSLRAPMGRAVAFATPAAADSQRLRLGGVSVTWTALVTDSAGIVTSGGH